MPALTSMSSDVKIKLLIVGAVLIIAGGASALYAPVLASWIALFLGSPLFLGALLTPAAD